MRTEVTFLRGVIFGVDKDRVVRAGSHAGLTTDADRLVKIDDSVGPFEHCRRWTRGSARSMSTLITTRYLVCATCLWEDADIYMFYVGSRD